MIKTKFTALAAALMLLASCTKIENVPTGGEITSAVPDTETTAETTVTETETTTTAPPEPEYAEISFLAVGDNLIHSSIYKQAAARAAASCRAKAETLEGILRKVNAALIAPDEEEKA